MQEKRIAKVKAELRAKPLSGVMEAKRASASRWAWILRAVLSYNWPRNDFSSLEKDLGDVCKARLPPIGSCRVHCREGGICLRLRKRARDGRDIFPAIGTELVFGERKGKEKGIS